MRRIAIIYVQGAAAGERPSRSKGQIRLC